MEIWKDIEGYEGLYQISNLGQVKSLKRTRAGRGGSIVPLRERILATTKDNDGYPVATFHINSIPSWYKVHRLVAMAFIPNPENKPEVNHINGNRGDNRVENLEWCTRSENERHSIQVLGKINGRAKITKEQVREIRQIYATGGITQKGLGALYGIHQAGISRIILNKGWL